MHCRPTSGHVHRRHFLAVSSAAALSATCVRITKLWGAGAQADDPFRGWPIGVQSYSLRNFDAHQAVRHIQGMGLHFVEMFGKHLSLQSTGEQIDQMRHLLAASKISLNAHGVNPFTKDHEANRKTFEFAKRAGIRNITADPALDSFDSLDKLVAEYQIRVCIHNHGPEHRYNSIESVQKAVDGHHALIGACVDTGHFIRSGVDPVEAITKLGNRVFAVHLKDDQYKGDKRSHNVVIGRANLDVAGVFRALKQIEFPGDGSISLEYESNPDNPIDDMKQCLEVIREAVANIVA
jgi:sugar phosphate isomerase/epimerase